MTQIYAKVIADSVNTWGGRLTTLEVRFHRFILAEFNTHRVFSRNSNSSRAIPISVTLEKLSEDWAFPLSLPSEQPGMSGGLELLGLDRLEAEVLLDNLKTSAVNIIQAYLDAHPDKTTRLHKSVLNRYLEPFLYQTAIVSSTEWENFFSQRISPLAQPEMNAIAELMSEAISLSTPKYLLDDVWHLPYITDEDRKELSLEDLKKVSVARCARVSYLNHGGVRSISDDLSLFEKLTSANPPHLSPLEHVATPTYSLFEDPAGNFSGWAQFRHLRSNVN